MTVNELLVIDLRDFIRAKFSTTSHTSISTWISVKLITFGDTRCAKVGEGPIGESGSAVNGVIIAVNILFASFKIVCFSIRWPASSDL